MNPFDASGFLTRGCCGEWTPTLILLYVGGSLAFAIAYFSIPLMLLWLYRKAGTRQPAGGMLRWFSTFILLCGVSHLCDAVSFIWAPYRLFTLVILLGAVVSVATALRLPKVVRTLATLKTPAEYQVAISERDAALAAVEQMLQRESQRAKALQREADLLREEFESLHHRQVTDAEYQHLRELLHNLRNSAK